MATTELRSAVEALASAAGTLADSIPEKSGPLADARVHLFVAAFALAKARRCVEMHGGLGGVAVGRG